MNTRRQSFISDNFLQVIYSKKWFKRMYTGWILIMNLSKLRLSRYYFRFATKNISKGKNILIVQDTILRKSSKRRAIQNVCIWSSLIMIFFELIPSTNRGGLLAELHRFQSIQPRAGIALTFWNLERWLSKTILVLYYILTLKNKTFIYTNIS